MEERGGINGKEIRHRDEAIRGKVGHKNSRTLNEKRLAQV